MTNLDQPVWTFEKVVFTAGAVVASALVAGFAISTYLFVLEKKAHKRAAAAERTQASLRQDAENARSNEAKLRLQAEAHERIAATEAGKSKQVAEFMKDMLKAVGPSVALGRDTTMLRELLDKTAGRVGRDLNGQPEVEAELRNTIGIAYAEIGQEDKAEAMHREALRLRKSLFRDVHATIAESLHNLGSALWQRESIASAEQMAREALAMRKQLYGQLHPDVAESLNLLGRILQRQSDLAGARAIHEEALRVRKSLFGETHPAVADSLSNLGEVLRLNSDDAGAESAQRQALAIRRKLFGELHPQVAQSLTRLAEVLRKRDSAGAESALREALALRTKLMGWEHPDVVRTLGALTDIYQSRGDPEGISNLLQELIRIDPQQSNLLPFRASLFARRGRWTEAIADLNRTLLLDPLQQSTYHALAPLYVQTGDLDGYREICRRMLARFGETTEPQIAERMVKDCLIVPTNGADPAVVARLADFLNKAAEQYSGNAWIEFAAGLAAYRQSHYKSAIQWTQKALRAIHPMRSVEAYMVLAMAHQRLQQTAQARQALADGLDHAQKNLPHLENGDLGRDWLDWIIAQALMREAKAMME